MSAAKIDGTPLSDLELSPRQQRSGWLLGEIPRPKARKTVSVVYQLDAFSTPPELKWTNTPRQGTHDLPQFAVENFQLPETAMQGEDATANVTILNQGNSTRTFQGLGQFLSHVLVLDGLCEGWEYCLRELTRRPPSNASR